MQKFTRAITREVELAGERLALTLDAEGISVRFVGSRKPPLTGSWAAILSGLAQDGGAPSEADVAAALEQIRGGKSAPRAATAEKAAPVEGSLTPTLARLEDWLAANRPRYHQNLRPGATPAEINAIGVNLPDDLRMLLAWHNGQGNEFAGALVQSWMLMGTGQIHAAKNTLDAGDPATGWRPDWVPFLEDDAGNYVCVDPSGPGASVREYWAGKAEHPVVAPSLRQWLETFVEGVDRGEYVEEPERGRFLKRT